MVKKKYIIKFIQWDWLWGRQN